MKEKITIAIDGYSSCGKSTLARGLARSLNYIFIDSGAMYRGVTLYALENNLIADEQVQKTALIAALPSIALSFERSELSGHPELLLNGQNVEKEIRVPRVSNQVSKVAAIREVREKLVEEQRKLGRHGGIVMDGRDIGSVVFPDAELKLFITAALEVRVERRFTELTKKGIEISRNEVRENLQDRDHLDSTRAESPLIRAVDAILLDNSQLNREEQLEIAIKHAKKLISKASR